MFYSLFRSETDRTLLRNKLLELDQVDFSFPFNSLNQPLVPFLISITQALSESCNLSSNLSIRISVVYICRYARVVITHVLLLEALNGLNVPFLPIL